MKKTPWLWYAAASFIGWPLTAVVVLSVPAVIAKLVWGVKLPVAWFVSMLAVLGLPTPVGYGVSIVALILATAAWAANRKDASPRRKLTLAMFGGVALVCLAYGLWFNVTRQGDTMF